MIINQFQTRMDTDPNAKASAFAEGEDCEKEGKKMKEMILYRCEICGNLICMVENSGVVPICCGKKMTAFTANSVDATVEKHVPVLVRDGEGAHVFVGKTPHPMTEEHRISHIFLLTNKGLYMRFLKSSEAPEVCFRLCPGEEILTAYALCNIHGLWKS